MVFDLNTLKNILNNMDKIINAIKKNIGIKLLISLFLIITLTISYNITGYDILLKIMYIPIAFISIVILFMTISIIISIFQR